MYKYHTDDLNNMQSILQLQHNANVETTKGCLHVHAAVLLQADSQTTSLDSTIPAGPPLALLNVRVAARASVVLQCHIPNAASHLIPDLAHQHLGHVGGPALRLSHGACVRPVYDDAVVCFIDEVRAAAYVIHARRRQARAAPADAKATLCAGVCHKPHVALVLLCKALDLGQHAADVLSFEHPLAPPRVQFIVRVDDQALDAIPANITGAPTAAG